MELFTENDQLLIENHIFEGAIERVFESNYYNVDIDANLNLYIEQLETDDVDLQLEENLSGIFEMEYNHIVPFYEVGPGTDAAAIKRMQKELESGDDKAANKRDRDSGSPIGQEVGRKREIKYSSYWADKKVPGSDTADYKQDSAIRMNKIEDNYNKKLRPYRTKASNLLKNMREKVGSTKLAKSLSKVKGKYDMHKGQGKSTGEALKDTARFVKIKAKSKIKPKAIAAASALKAKGGAMVRKFSDLKAKIKPKKATA